MPTGGEVLEKDAGKSGKCCRKDFTNDFHLEMCRRHEDDVRGPFERKESGKECSVGKLLQCKVKNYLHLRAYITSN